MIKISSVYNKYANGHKFPQYRVISSTSNLIAIQEADIIKNETRRATKFLNACNVLINSGKPNANQKPFADMLDIANRCDRDEDDQPPSDGNLSEKVVAESSADYLRASDSY